MVISLINAEEIITNHLMMRKLQLVFYAYISLSLHILWVCMSQMVMNTYMQHEFWYSYVSLCRESVIKYTYERNIGIMAIVDI